MSRRRTEPFALPLRAALLLLGAACGDEACLVPPCALPAAVVLSVRDSASAAPVAGAEATFTGPMTGGGPCGSATCVVPGGPGTYEIDVRAPGYRPAHRQVVVAGTAAAACTCGAVETRQVVVSLARAE